MKKPSIHQGFQVPKLPADLRSPKMLAMGDVSSSTAYRYCNQAPYESWTNEKPTVFTWYKAWKCWNMPNFVDDRPFQEMVMFVSSQTVK